MYVSDVRSFQTVPRKAMRCAFSVSPEIPAKLILLPGICFPGLSRYIQRCLSLQVTPDPFMALL